MKDIYCLFICVFHLLVQLPIKERKKGRKNEKDRQDRTMGKES